jgi:sugar phosphate isomerase/epimerase
VEIELGCLNRPWYDFTLAESLAGIGAAGFPVCGFISQQQGRPLISDTQAEADLAAVNALVAQHGLRAQVLISNTDTNLSLEASVAKLRTTISRARALGLSHLVLTGTHDESKYEAWYAATAQGLDFAQEQGVKVLLKAHGGMCALAEDLLYARERLSHPNFGLCYDPGNIYYYTGEKAEEDLPKVAAHVDAMCLKDETGGKHGDVMLTLGTGLVDFPRIFSILNDHGFSGPCWVECVGGKTLAEIDAEAKKTYDFITQVVAGI